MRLSSFPFLIVFLCCLTPMAGAMLNVATLHVSAGFVLSGWAISALISAKPFTFPRYQVALIIFMICLLYVQVAVGHGFVLLEGGFYLLVFAFLFYQMLQVGEGTSYVAVIRQISLIHKFFLICMVVEFVIILMGGQIFLYDLFNTTEALPYRLNAKADIPLRLGIFTTQGGLNSVLLGPQISGMLALHSLVWFAGIRRISGLHLIEKRPRFWAWLSFVMLLVCLGGTVAVLAMLAMLMHAIFINRKALRPMLIAFAFLSVALYVLIANELLFDRIFFGGNVYLPQEQLEKVPEFRLIQGAGSVEFYVFAFTIPFLVYSLIDWPDILIGIGAEAFSTKFVFVGSDLGFAADILIKNGVIWTIVFTATMIAICYPALMDLDRKSGAGEAIKWHTLASINAFLCVLWLASTAHYNQALKNSGGLVLFALHLAIVMYARKRARTGPALAGEL